ncbi:hypothetical protein ACE1SV_41220 [Streptomyces sp. E-15]
MAEHGGGAGPVGDVRRSRLYDYADLTGPGAQGTTEPEASAAPAAPEHTPPPDQVPPAARPDDGRRAFAALLGEFRRTAVLVPLDEETGAPLAADHGGLRFLLAFSDEEALARYAVARGEAAREWRYLTVLGARLLDAAVPAVGVPCGVALDCADGADGMVFPPVRGIVPDAVAVDVDGGRGDER